MYMAVWNRSVVESGWHSDIALAQDSSGSGFDSLGFFFRTLQYSFTNIVLFVHAAVFLVAIAQVVGFCLSELI